MAKELDRPDAIQGQPHILYQLAVAHLHNDEDAGSLGESTEIGFRKRIQRDGPQYTNVDAVCTRLRGDGFQNATDNAVANENNLGAFGLPLFGAGLSVLRAAILLFEIAVVRFKIVDIHEERCDQVSARFGSPGDGPIRLLRWDGSLRKLDRLHHLADESIGEEHNRVPIAVCQFEGQRGEVGHLLHGMRSQDDGAVVTVAATLYHLVVVTLLGSDVAQTRPTASNVGNDAGQLRAGHVADAFLHEADSGAAGGSHAAHSGGSPAIVVVTLLGSDVAQTRPTASNVGNDAGQLRAGHVADAFLHEADSGAAGGSHAGRH